MARQRELLSLLQISEETGISYPTLRKYAAEHGDEIPSEGEGRQTRYPRAAVRVFQRLRSQSKPGRKPKAERLEAQAQDESPSPSSIPNIPSVLRPAAAPRLFQREPVQPERPEPRREATSAGIALPAEIREDLRDDLRDDLHAIRGALETISRHLEKGVGLLALLAPKQGQPEPKQEKTAEAASPSAVSPAPVAAAPSPAPPAPPAPIPAAARLEVERPERPESFGPRWKGSAAGDDLNRQVQAGGPAGHTVRHGRSAAHRVTLGPKVRGKAGPRPE